jgi:hypothetical protein
MSLSAEHRNRVEAARAPRQVRDHEDRNDGGDRPPAPAWAALIPIKKSAVWWAMAQDERRAIFEERSGR